MIKCRRLSKCLVLEVNVEGTKLARAAREVYPETLPPAPVCVGRWRAGSGGKCRGSPVLQYVRYSIAPEYLWDEKDFDGAVLATMYTHMWVYCVVVYTLCERFELQWYESNRWSRWTTYYGV